ncbi:MAG: 3'-5' exonuclease [Candidatus Chromulinivorax sp.]|nr:3'-5' exonuclease [Candidatus Chromulinivorax sp.]
MSYDKKEQFQHFLQTQLNEPQRKAVEKTTGSLLVIAGAGSGKTRVITARITNLIVNHGVDPRSIVALTFTNKAAKEMQERVGKFLLHQQQLPTVSTFHSYCLQILKTHQRLLPFENFVIMDSADQQKLVGTILKKHELEKRVNLKQILYTISSYKNRNATGTDFDDADSASIYRFHDIYNAYEQEKRLSKCLDFDDLLVYTLKLFQENKEFKARFQATIRHVLVDEYQDTNTIQNELLRHMALDAGQKLTIDSICAVGDEDQSIYSWRGATIENILKFSKDFGTAETIKIEQNYRSTQHILDIANHVITNNSARNHKNLWSDNKETQKTIIFECNSEFQEADMISALVQTVHQHESLQSIAILYRTHYQSRVLEEAMIKANIPYKIIGGIQFYERKEIKDLLSYLRFFFNPFDRISFSRIINCPTRGLGAKFEEEFDELWSMNPFSSGLDITKMMLEQKLTATKHQALNSFRNLFINMPEDITPIMALKEIIEKTHYIDYLDDNFEKAEAQTKKENIQELLRAVIHFQEEGTATVSGLLEAIALMQDSLKKQDQAKEYVQMMTFHSAKGLEFNTIILPGLEDGIIPSTPSINDSNVEEERRLFYVGLTRACKRLLLTHCRTRNTYGQTNVQIRSRFLDEIPPHFVIEQPANYWSQNQAKTYFTQWIKGNAPQAIDTDHVYTYSSAHTPSYQTSAKTPASFGSKQYATKNSTQKGEQFNKVSAIQAVKDKLAALQKSVTPNSFKPQNSTTMGTPASPFKKMQTIEHTTFGLGIVHEVELKGTITIVTVRFHLHGMKKMDSKFLEII